MLGVNGEQSGGGALPTAHSGLHYIPFMSSLSRSRGTRTYLEIGVQSGHLLSGICADHAVAVDPAFQICNNVISNKKSLYLYNGTSDRFFSDPKAQSILGAPIDLAFLDGMHVFEFLLRDFYNAEALSSKNGLIIMHDCLPLTAAMANRNMSQAVADGENTPYATYWTGDVWKAVSILYKYRPDLKIICLDCHPTGLICVTNLDPTSQVLSERYTEIVDELSQASNDEAALRKFYASIDIKQAQTIVNDFDHSLFFRV